MPPFRSPLLGLLSAAVFVVGMSLAAIPVAEHWEGRGGEEWWVALVIGAAAACVLRGLFALRAASTRRWGAALAGGGALGLVVVFAGFTVYFIGLGGSLT